MNNNLTLIIQFFEKLKLQVKTFKDPVVFEYYQRFFNDFRPLVLTSNCCFNQGNPGLERIKQFNRVHDLNQFQDYLKSIPGLYPKLILWAIAYPFPKNETSPVIKHHAMPKFLARCATSNTNTELNQFLDDAQIEAKFNLVQIGWLIHFIMHFIRAVEYNQTGDFSSLAFVINPPGLAKKKLSSNIQKKFKTDFLITDLLQDFTWPFIKTNAIWLKNDGFMGPRQINPNVKKILTSKTVWRHKNNFAKGEKGFSLIFDPQSIYRCSFSRFTVEFINQANLYYLQVFGISFEADFYHLNQTLAHHFKGFTGSVSNFYMVDPPDFIKPVALVGNDRYS